MKPSVAFFSTIEWVTELTSNIFSIGHSRIFHNDSIFIVPLFLLGQFAKFVIGYPLGFIVGAFAAGIVALINLFNPERQPGTAVQNQIEPEVVMAAAPILEAETAILQPTIVVQEAPVPSDEITKRTETVNRKSFAEKKTKLLGCADSLAQCIDQKLTRIQAVVQPYEESQQRIGHLKRELQMQNTIALSAKKFSHTETMIARETVCPCGNKAGFILFQCGLCKGPVFQKEIHKKNPVYIADTAARQTAQQQAQIIAAELSEETKKYSQPPAECAVKAQLSQLNDQLRRLLPATQSEVSESHLLSLLSRYKKILSEAENCFSTEDQFHKADFIPKSDYAQHYVAVKMLQQATRQNGLFQSLPIELQENVALFTTSSAFSEGDARHVFGNS